jgi:hypothetical protein
MRSALSGEAWVRQFRRSLTLGTVFEARIATSGKRSPIALARDRAQSGRRGLDAALVGQFELMPKALTVSMLIYESVGSALAVW